MRRACAAASLLLLLCGLPAAAEAAVELRSGASLDLRISKPLAVSFEEEVRLDMRPGESGQWLHSVVLKISPLKWLRIEPQYRFSVRPGLVVSDPELRHRLALGLRFRVKLGVLRLSVRERYQVRLSNRGDTPRQHLVSKVRARFRHDDMPVVPALWLEFFLRMPEDEDPVLADTLRVGLGLAIPTKVVEIAFEVQFEKSIKNPEEALLPLLGLNFEFELDPRPRKKGKASSPG